MFSKWHLKDTPFNTNPISQGTLFLFSGREQELKICRSLLAGPKANIAIEGGLGIGTTSFGNYLRFHAENKITPMMEIPAGPDWNLEILLQNILICVSQLLAEKGITAKSSKFRKVLEITTVIENRAIGAGVNILGLGGSFSRGQTLSMPAILPMETLRSTLGHLVEIARSKLGKGLLIQLNNFDLGHTFSPEKLTTFLNDIRDLIQLEGISWLLLGNEYFLRHISRNVPRIDTVLNYTTSLKSLSLQELKESLKARVESLAIDKSAQLPVSDDLLEELYQMCEGSIREIFLLANQLSVMVSGDPMIKRVEIKHAVDLIKGLSQSKLSGVSRGTDNYKLLEMIVKNPGVQPKELTALFKKKQTYISARVRDLLNKNLITEKKSGRMKYLQAKPFVRLALR